MISFELMCVYVFFFFKQKTAYEMRISDWSSDVCSSDLLWPRSSICSASLASAASSAVKVGVVTGQHLPAISGPVGYRPLAAATYRTSLLPSKTDYKDMSSNAR